MIDWTKPVETDEDEPSPVRVLCTDGPFSVFPVVCIVYGNIRTANIDGVLNGNGTNLARLRNARPKPVKREGWVALYRLGTMLPGCTHVCATEEKAAAGIPQEHFIATARIEWEEVPNDA